MQPAGIHARGHVAADPGSGVPAGGAALSGGETGWCRRHRPHATRRFVAQPAPVPPARARGGGQAARREAAGFTLTELLVAFTILGFLFALLQDGFVLGHRIWERANLRPATRIEPVEGVQHYLRERIARAYPVWRPIGDPQIDFAGDSQRLTFEAAPADAQRPATRQRHVLSLSGEGALEIAWRPDTDRSPLGAYQRATLMEGVTALEISYFGSTGFDRQARWRDAWRAQIRPPQAVRIRVAFAPGDPRIWPDLVVTPRIGVDSSCIFEAQARNCRGRP